MTSLHDGMNLVAKEFVAARDDEHGVLVLSQFAGAARELHEALIVNPYDIERGGRGAASRAADAGRRAARAHAQPCGSLVSEHNVYRWAGADAAGGGAPAPARAHRRAHRRASRADPVGASG